jgi:hypothetical protein
MSTATFSAAQQLDLDKKHEPVEKLTSEPQQMGTTAVLTATNSTVAQATTPSSASSLPSTSLTTTVVSLSSSAKTETQNIQSKTVPLNIDTPEKLMDALELMLKFLSVKPTAAAIATTAVATTAAAQTTTHSSGSAASLPSSASATTETQNIQSFAPLFPEGKIPKTVQVADWPLGPHPVFKDVPLTEFLKMSDRQGWTETLLVDKASSEQVLSANALKTLNTILSSDPSAFGFVNMGKYGWGAVSLKRIPKGARLLYSGVVKEGQLFSANLNTHCLTLDTENERGGSIIGVDRAIRYVDPKGYGNVASYFQHAPSEATLEEYSFSSKTVRKQISPANYVPKFLTVEGKVLAYLESTRVIEPFELVTFDYDIGFWRAMGKTPTLFDQNMNAISHDLYSYKDVKIKIIHPAYGQPYPIWHGSFNKFSALVTASQKAKQPFVIPFVPYDIEVPLTQLNEQLSLAPANPLVLEFRQAVIKPSKRVKENIFAFFGPWFSETMKKYEALGIDVLSLTDDQPPHFQLMNDQTVAECENMYMGNLRKFGLESYVYCKLSGMHPKKGKVFKLCIKNPKEFAEKLEKVQIIEGYFMPITSCINNIFGEKFKQRLGSEPNKAWTLITGEFPRLELTGFNILSKADFQWYKVKLEKKGLSAFVECKPIQRGSSEVYRLCFNNLPALRLALEALDNKPVDEKKSKAKK